MFQNAHWISDPLGDRAICPVFECIFTVEQPVKKATLRASARGAYEAFLGGKRIGEEVLTPGCTVFEKRTQYQEYDITSLITDRNELHLRLAGGWYKGKIASEEIPWRSITDEVKRRTCAVIAEIELLFADGSVKQIVTDDSWRVADSELRFCDIYDGCVYDATVTPRFDRQAIINPVDDRSMLIPQEGERIVTHERLKPIAVIHTPKGETVLDFGQNMTGTVELSLNAHTGEKVALSFAEVLDGEGNFYNENYRTAKCLYDYTCTEGVQTFMPTLTFYGFRYVRVDAFPGEVDPDAFRAVVIHSEMKRTGHFKCSDPLVNQLYSNIIWGQRSNYLDIPTDCPQRDERLGWTGDAQIFSRAAAYNYDVRKFFRKWLADMRDSQRENGGIPVTIPDATADGDYFAAAWSDAVAIIPWELYRAYGDTSFMKLMFPAMKRWNDYVANVTPSYPLWTDHFQYGDWVALDAPYGSYRGSSREDLVSTAFFAYTTHLICRIGRILGEDISLYEKRESEIEAGFKAAYDGDFRTQTEHILALQFGLTDHPEETIKSLVALLEKDGVQLKTGFVGTPYIMHVLADCGYADLAYQLLLRTEYPSWLYPVTIGATTMWEHWDNVRPDGTMWSTDMNSFNHYAYGAVADWLYGVCAGINPDAPGYATVRFTPTPTKRLEYAAASLETDHGTVSSRWWWEDGVVHYEFVTPCDAVAVIDGKPYSLKPGTHRF